MNSCFYESMKIFIKFKKTVDAEKAHFLKLRYGLDVSENSKVVYGRSSTKWTSWKSNDMLIKIE